MACLLGVVALNPGCGAGVGTRADTDSSSRLTKTRDFLVCTEMVLERPDASACLISLVDFLVNTMRLPSLAVP